MLTETKNVLAQNLFGMSIDECVDKGVCINCKKLVYWSNYEKLDEEGNIYSDAGMDEFRISGLCEYCFDKIMQETGE